MWWADAALALASALVNLTMREVHPRRRAAAA
jgi:hypothetical protein